jgi:uncharacterized protein
MAFANPPHSAALNRIHEPGKISDKLDDKLISRCTLGRLPPWGMPYAEDLMCTLLSSREPFPCTFAVTAAKQGSLRFGFIESLHETGAWWPLLGILSSYLKGYQKISRNTSLVVFFALEDGCLALGDYYQKFWGIMQFLHDNDPEEWPASIPCQVDHGWWEFSFGGVPIFAVCSTPAHDSRKSRSSPVFLITFQPRWVFEGLEAGTLRGATMRRVIRERLRAYDQVEPSPELGAYGDAANREWRQYFLPDDNQASFPRCPFQHRGSIARRGISGIPG